MGIFSGGTDMHITPAWKDRIEHVASKSTWCELLTDEAFIDSMASFEKEQDN